MHGSPKWSLSFRFANQNPVYASPPFHTCHMPRSCHSSPFYNPNNIGLGLQIIKPLIMYFLHSLFTSSLLGPNILFNTLFSNTISLCSSINVSDQVSHPYPTIGETLVLYILISKFLYSNTEDERLSTKWYQAFLTPTPTAACSLVTILTVMLISTVHLATGNLMLMHLYVLCFRFITT